MKATHVEHAVHVARAMQQVGVGLPLKLLSQMIAALPCRVSSAHAVAFVNAMGPTVSGLDAASRGYLNTYYRLLVMVGGSCTHRISPPNARCVSDTTACDLCI